jgi:hypothetical protein
LDLYKVYRQQLFKCDREGLQSEGEKKDSKLADKWNKVNKDIAIIFYDQVTDDENNEHWFEFEFTFNKGKLDKKKLLSVRIETTAKERADIDKMWDTEQEIFDEYRDNNFPYKLYTWLEKRFQKMTNWARNKHSLPIEVRKEAYEKSGRLKKDPKALDLYLDV